MNIYPLENEDFENFQEFISQGNFETDECMEYCIDALVDDETNMRGRDIQNTLTQLGRTYKNIESELNGVISAIDTLKTRREILERKTETLKEYMRREMISADIKKISDDYFIMSIKNNPASVAITDEDKLSNEYKIEKVFKMISKEKIKEDLKQGVIVDGAELRTSTRLEIK